MRGLASPDELAEIEKEDNASQPIDLAIPVGRVEVENTANTSPASSRPRRECPIPSKNAGR